MPGRKRDASPAAHSPRALRSSVARARASGPRCEGEGGPSLPQPHWPAAAGCTNGAPPRPGGRCPERRGAEITRWRVCKELRESARQSLRSASGSESAMSSALLLTGLVLYSTTISAFQTSRYQHLREKCRTIPKCESIWNSTENVCSTPEFEDCNCTKAGCDIQMLLGKTCFSNQGHLEPSSSPDISMTFPEPTKLKEVAQLDQLGKDCMMAKDMCQKNNTCSLLYECFQKRCRTEESSSNCRRVGHRCLKAWQGPKKASRGGCKCPEPMCEKCTGIWKNIFNNSYLHQLPEYQVSPLHKKTSANERPQNFNTDTDHRNIEAEWKSSSLSNTEYQPQHSCLHIQVECVSDAVCNRQLSNYLLKCQATGTPSSVSQCKKALRTFYQNMPLNVAQKLIFCDCEEFDEPCLHSKKLLHGKPNTNVVQVPSCLSMFQTCRGDSLCWEKYKEFMSTCLDGISQLCLENNACMEYLDTKDLKCSDSAACRKAYIGIWGILPAMECVCEARSPAEQPLCQLFYHTLQSNSCFSQIAGRKAEHYPLLTDLPETKPPAILKESLFVGDTIYIAMYSCCAILILGLILLALLKTRALSKQAKTSSPAPLSERLMIPQQPWVVNCVDNDFPGFSQSQSLTRLS
ncbi:GDNF family receptor alpha-like isoform X2 [Paroedura picta]|uniref:GDNF family receptor alpha-like isoform X2 n=1 Tax=Paroedura picta TaxID=143630 RepID=UPI004055C0DE